jgi:class 3 adenylate cyclase
MGDTCARTEKRLQRRASQGGVSLQRENRRLAAIIAADIAGYSRLIGQDEEGTLRALRAHRNEFIDRIQLAGVT